nr:hypothetical protein [Tanacetum cinerariifolium]
MYTGMSHSAGVARISAKNSSPFIRGIFRSSKMSSGRGSMGAAPPRPSSIFSASSPLKAVCSWCGTLNLAKVFCAVIVSNISSSTSRTERIIAKEIKRCEAVGLLQGRDVKQFAPGVELAHAGGAVVDETIDQLDLRAVPVALFFEGLGRVARHHHGGAEAAAGAVGGHCHARIAGSGNDAALGAQLLGFRNGHTQATGFKRTRRVLALVLERRSRPPAAAGSRATRFAARTASRACGSGHSAGCGCAKATRRRLFLMGIVTLRETQKVAVRPVVFRTLALDKIELPEQRQIFDFNLAKLTSSQLFQHGLARQKSQASGLDAHEVFESFGAVHQPIGGKQAGEGAGGILPNGLIRAPRGQRAAHARRAEAIPKAAASQAAPAGAPAGDERAEPGLCTGRALAHRSQHHHLALRAAAGGGGLLAAAPAAPAQPQKPQQRQHPQSAAGARDRAGHYRRHSQSQPRNLHATAHR